MHAASVTLVEGLRLVFVTVQLRDRLSDTWARYSDIVLIIIIIIIIIMMT